MGFTPRYYQQEGIDIAIDFFNDKIGDVTLYRNSAVETFSAGETFSL